MTLTLKTENITDLLNHRFHLGFQILSSSLAVQRTECYIRFDHLDFSTFFTNLISLCGNTLVSGPNFPMWSLQYDRFLIVCIQRKPFRFILQSTNLIVVHVLYLLLSGDPHLLLSCLCSPSLFILVGSLPYPIAFLPLSVSERDRKRIS